MIPISLQTAGNVARFQAATDLQAIARTKPLTGALPSAIPRRAEHGFASRGCDAVR